MQARHWRQQEIDSVSHCCALAVTKKALFPLTVSLWFQFREHGCRRWETEIEEELLQSILSHRWVLGQELHASCDALDRILPKHWLAAGLAPLNPSPQLIDTGVSPAWVKVCHPQALSWGGPFPPAKQLQAPQQTSCKVGSGGKRPPSSGHPEVSVQPSEMQVGLSLKCSSLRPAVPSAVQHAPERG